MTEMTRQNMTVPLLHTERLILRAHGIADFGPACALWGDDDVVRFISGTPSPPSQVWRRLLAYAGHWALMGFGYWALEHRDTGAFVGEVGFADFRREIDPPMGETPETGWLIAPAFWGQGMASEAVTAAVAWGDAHFTQDRMACLIHPDNGASVRVAEKLGFRLLRQVTMEGQTSLWFERMRAP